MTVLVRISPDSSTDLEVDLSRLPVTVDLSQIKRPGEAYMLTVFALVWLAGVSVFGALAFSNSQYFPMFIALAMMVIGVVVLRQGLVRLTTSNSMTFGKNHVEIVEKRLFRVHKWSASYKDYNSVRLRGRSVNTGDGDRAQYEVIELVHEDETKTLPLYVKRDGERPVERLREYADIFGLPARTSKRNKFMKL